MVTHKKSQMLVTRFLDEYRAKQVPINKVFDSTQKEILKKGREFINPIVNSLKLSGLQIIPLRGHNTAQKIQKLEKVVLLIQ